VRSPGASTAVRFDESGTEWVVEVEAVLLVPPGGDAGSLVVAISGLDAQSQRQVGWMDGIGGCIELALDLYCQCSPDWRACLVSGSSFRCSGCVHCQPGH